MTRERAPFPAPATSHVAWGFPALRVPAHFTTRVTARSKTRPGVGLASLLNDSPSLTTTYFGGTDLKVEEISAKAPFNECRVSEPWQLRCESIAWRPSRLVRRTSIQNKPNPRICLELQR